MTWSPLEYACHVRDVCRIFGERLALMLGEDAPAFANWDQDATAVEDRYGEQDPATVGREVVEAGAALSTAFARVPDDAWGRTGIRSDGSAFTVLTLGQYGLHDLVHHLWDVGAGPPVNPELVYLLLGGSLLLASVLPAAAAPLGAVGARSSSSPPGCSSGSSPRWPRCRSTRWRPAPSSSTSPRSPSSSPSWASAWRSTGPLRWRDRGSWRAWSPAWRLLGIAMPLTIGAVALLAWGPLGVAAPAALLLGAALSPTDPVLASDVQVEGPTLEGEADEIDEEDEVRFALTSEAGLNDGLAFPFVYAAIFLASVGPVSQWGLELGGLEPRRQGRRRRARRRRRRVGHGPAGVPRPGPVAAARGGR